MTYNEFISYLADQILDVRTRAARVGHVRNFSSYSEAGTKAALECRSFFDRFTLDEGPHNDYNPNSKVSTEAYRAALYSQIAAAVGKKTGSAGAQDNVRFLDSVLVQQVGYHESVSNQRFSRVAAEYVAALIVFERTCAECGAKYSVELKGQTYQLKSNHPPTCIPKQVASVQSAPVQVTPAPAAPVQAPKPQVTEKAEGRSEPLMLRYMRWEARQTSIRGPVIPQNMLAPTQKPAYDSPAYRANAKAALQLYADFLKFYVEDPSPKSRPEDNQREMERMYNVVMRTVFNFDPNANKKQK